MGTRMTIQSHRQPVKLFEGSTNVIPQLYQSHHWAQYFITDREGQTEREIGKRKGENVTMDHWYNGPAGISDVRYRWGAGKEERVVTEQGRGGQWSVSMLFSPLNCTWRGNGDLRAERQKSCSSIRICVLLPAERLELYCRSCCGCEKPNGMKSNKHWWAFFFWI